MTTLAESAPKTPTSATDQLVDFVLQETGGPVDNLAVAATLESRGIRDVDARDTYGAADVFDLAERVYQGCLTARAGNVVRRAADLPPLRRRAVQAFRWYGQGTLKSLPIVLQTAAVVLLGYAMWSSLTFDRRLATTVAVATIVSFLVTGGFVQAIGRLSTYYLEQRSYVLARSVSWRLLRTGTACVLVAGAVGVLAIAAGSAVSLHLALVGAVYYLFLSPLWLALALLYSMERRVAVIVVFGLGTGVVSLLQLVTPVPIVASHLAGLGVAVAVATVYAAWLLTRLERSSDAAARLARLPRSALLGFGVAPYFAYGILYFALLFLDRLIGWSAGRHPLPIWFDTPYEYGLDFALLALVLTLPQLEYAIHRFSSKLVPVQQAFDATDAGRHNAHFLRFYLRQVGWLGLVAAVSAGLMWQALLALRGGRGFLNLATPDPVVLHVFTWGVAGYLLLAFGLLNGVFLFSLSRPRSVLLALVLAVPVDLVTGSVLSREGAYWHSVIGMTAGALIFAVVTTVGAVRVLRRLDYYYYSAY